MERRTSTNSESSIEPADVTSSNKTSSDINSSLAIKTSQESDNENVESDENEDYLNNNTCKSNKSESSGVSQKTSGHKDSVVRRDNLRQLMDKMLQKKMSATTRHNNNHSSEENLNSSSHDANNESDQTTKDDTTKYICPICEAVSTTQHDFTNHIRNHNNTRDSSDDSSSFTCRICSKVLSSASSLDRHVLVHTGERPFNCKFCNLTFTTNGNMHRHMRTHKQPQHDRESYESDGSTDSSGSSNRKVHNYPHKRKSADDEHTNKRKIRAVNYNNNTITSPSLLQQQQMQKFCCPVCIRNDFPNMISLENHMDKEHPTIPAKCRHCEMVFKSHKALNGHRCGHNKSNNNVQQGFGDLSSIIDFSCDKFPLIAQRMCEQSIRTPITNQKYECRTCFRAFPCASSAESHMKECNDSAPSNKRRRSRSETSADDEEMRREDFFANLALQNRPPSTSSSIDKFSSTSMVIKQELRETPPFYQYFSEGRDFADIESIIKATSSGGLEKPIPEKDQHLYNREEEEVQDAFTQEFRKMKLRGEFPCRLCTMVFPNLRALKGHNRVHLSAAGPGPYRCNMCLFTINDKQALIRHMRNHNGDRPYECALCNYAFTTKANCERHLRNRHGKLSREEVKRAIIYHPSEDSSVDDHSKKIALFSANSSRYSRSNDNGDDDDYGDDDLDNPSGRSTPVSHLKDILQSRKDDSPSRIQVKSLDKLKSQQNFDNDIEEELNETSSHRPVDMSMDALDLSKKTDSFAHNNGNEASGEDESDQERNNEDDLDHPEIPKFDLAMFEKNFLMQQQLLTEALPKLDAAQMFNLAQMYRTFGFPTPGFPIHPALFLQNPLLLNDTMKSFFQKDMMPPTPPQSNAGATPTTTAMSGGSLIVNPFVSPDSSPTGPPNQPRTLDQSPINSSIPIPPFPPTPQESPKKHSTPNSSSINHLANHSGPVKMVIKNGVLMPKQKQRRYRTERPFACEHCSARFTLRSNMERHIKQQHPQFWAQRQRGNHGLMRRGPSASSQMNMNGASMMPTLQASGFGGISDQVKYAILAQQLKARDSPKSMMSNSFPPLPLPLQTQLTVADEIIGGKKAIEKTGTPAPAANPDDDDPQLIIDEDFHAEDLSKSSDGEKNSAARKVAENILEEAMKMGSSHVKNMISKAAAAAAAQHIDSDEDDEDDEEDEDEKEYEKERKVSHHIKEEGNDLVSVSKLIDNATNSMMFSNYFR
jgi:hypothetical protein